MNIIVTYQSKTGFTKKYAEWISEELNAKLLDIKKIKKEDISKAYLIIHGGWIMAGKVKGLDKIIKLNPNNLIVFGVGYTPKDKVNLNQLKETNKLDNIPFFYFEGGTNPKKMGFFGKTIVKLVTKEKVSYKDNTNKKDIANLIKIAK